MNFQDLAGIAASLPDAISQPAAQTDIAKLKNALAALAAAETPLPSEPGRKALREQFQSVLDRAGLKAGARIAEIGGAKNSFFRDMPDYPFTFLSIYPVAEADHIVADICHCPHVPNQSFDAVFSAAVLEHVRNPWLAGREINRILRPGGVVFHTAPFSYFYHGAPEDYWRYTTVGLAALFPGFETVLSEFESRGRRRNNLGNASNPVDGDGGPQFAPDAFGGWRENWGATYAGIKPLRSAQPVNQQLVVDLMKALTRHGLSETEATELTAQGVRILHFDDQGRLRKLARPRRLTVTPAKVKHIWRRKRSLGLLPSHYQFVLPAMFPLEGLTAELRALREKDGRAGGPGAASPLPA